MEKTVNFDLTGKVAIVTGGSRGLGVELATSMAEYGADIALMAGNVEKMKKVAADITEKTGRKVIWVKVNIGDEESVKAAVQTVMDEYGKIDILVNNAGIIRYGRPEEMTYKDWTDVLNIDVTGTWLMSKEVVNVYMGEHGGKIVNINSVNSFSASPVAPVYHVAKAAEAALTQSCAAAWAGQAICRMAKWHRIHRQIYWKISEEKYLREDLEVMVICQEHCFIWYQMPIPIHRVLRLPVMVV